VLPADLLDELRLLPGRYRTRDVVRDQWQIGHRTGGGRGITCLFAGPSGTGKTLAAEAVAHALGVELFVIDLSQIVDKYIGETEKNLERVFSEAEGVNGVLLFDEADALFGKRTDVRSSHDRHANVEVAYLLQRMERYDGVAVLTTNLRGNIDEAFTRRLDVVCGFVEPGVSERLALWERHLPPVLPQAEDVDLSALAAHFPISGGIIRNVAVTAAHAAAATGMPVSQRMLVEATRREYTKIGRLFPEGAAALLQ
jgi:SpoVK/Ycf46/Vps4 family AAA+-type ATPase